VIERACDYNLQRMTKSAHCDLGHQRAVAAVVRVVVKSMRVGKPGHPMTRELALCAAHARELRDFGVDVVRA
jgi:hypothetical protein